MDYYACTGELFNVSSTTPGDKATALYEQMEEFLEAHGVFPGNTVMRICEQNWDPKKTDQDIFDCLSDSLAQMCPPGHYFAESAHDPGIYGFWPVPNCFSEVHP